MIRFLLATIMVVALHTSSWAGSQLPPRPMDACANLAPYGFPQMNLPTGTPICRLGYVLLHDNRALVAAWVTYTLTREQTLSCLPRVDAFEADQSLPRGERAELAHYRRSGYDMGHLAPNADLSWDVQVQRESFLLSNMAPQLPGLNRGLWRELESIIRIWAYTHGPVTIYTGSIYDHTGPKLMNAVVIPQAFYKIVINNQTGETLAFLFPHQSNLGGEISAVQTTVATIESYTQIQFATPDDKTLQRPLWPINTRALNQARASLCKKQLAP